MFLPFAAFSPQPPIRDRAAFEAAISRVDFDMSPAQVQELLGKPDDIVIGDDARTK